jgi:hypothetical protein
MPTTLDIEASALMADPARGRLYAVVTAEAAQFQNELVVIDVGLGDVAASVAVGSNPDSLALSDDGTRLWIGLHGALSIREVDLTKWPPVPGAQYILVGNDAHDAVHAGPMAVLPGEPTSVAVSLQYDGLSPSFAGALVLDAGNPRPNQTRGHTGASRLTGGPPGYLFGFNDQHTGFEFYSIAVDATGLTQTEHKGLIDGFDSDIVYGPGYVLSTSGEVVDVSTPTMPVRVGKFAHAGLIAQQTAQGRVVMLSAVQSPSSSSSELLVLRQLDLATFRQNKELPVSGTYAGTRAFVEAVPGLFAFIEASTRRFGEDAERSRVHLLAAPELAE